MQPALRSRQPRLSDQVGAVHLLLVLDRPSGTEEVLAPGIVLPCRWVRGGGGRAGLPPELACLAAHVAECAGIEGFTLEIDPRLGSVDLSALPMRVESCFAPLFASLVIANQGGQPAPSVFATGRELDGGGIGAVEGVGAKISAVASLGIEGAVVFVPAANLPEAQEAVAAQGFHLGVQAFPVTEPTHLRTIAGLLAALDLPPSGAGADLDARLAWSNRDHRLHAPERDTYYLDHLVRGLAERLADDPALGGGVVSSLAVAVSHNWPLVVLLVLVFRPARVLLLCSPETQEHRAEIEAQVRDQDVFFESVQIDPEDPATALGQTEVWLGGAPDRRRVVEITGGTKLMSTVLVVAAQRTGAEILYLEQVVRNHRNVFGTERVRVLGWASHGGAA